MATVTGNSQPRLAIKQSVISADLDGEAVLLDVESGAYYGLDEVAARIWKFLEQGASEEAICAELVEEYEVTPAELRSDIAAFLAILASKGLASPVAD
jgi:PqqD family protein of HPr-rel-A system